MFSGAKNLAGEAAEILFSRVAAALLLWVVPIPELDDGNTGKPGNIWKSTMVSMVSGRFSQQIHSSQEFGHHVADARSAGRSNLTQGDGEQHGGTDLFGVFAGYNSYLSALDNS